VRYFKTKITLALIPLLLLMGYANLPWVIAQDTEYITRDDFIELLDSRFTLEYLYEIEIPDHSLFANKIDYPVPNNFHGQIAGTNNDFIFLGTNMDKGILVTWFSEQRISRILQISTSEPGNYSWPATIHCLMPSGENSILIVVETRNENQTPEKFRIYKMTGPFKPSMIMNSIEY
jgi:hypothetical protein